MNAQSAGALGQASASPKSKAGLVAHRARGDLQRFVGDVEGKYFFLSLRGDIQHGIDPTLWCSSINAILLVISVIEAMNIDLSYSIFMLDPRPGRDLK